MAARFLIEFNSCIFHAQWFVNVECKEFQLILNKKSKVQKHVVLCSYTPKKYKSNQEKGIIQCTDNQ